MGPLKSIWNWFRKPSSTWGTGILLVAGGVAGVIFWGGFHTAMEKTNSLGFCISCHETEDTVYQEYIKTPHYSNPSGVRAICSDCHVPREWQHKVVRKIRATKELYYKFIDPSIDTPEKFEAKRLHLAKNVWAEMESNNSRECRNCHSYDAMAFDKQHEKAAKQMKAAKERGDTCISCHKGIAHKMPDMSSGYKLAFEELQAKAKDEGAKASELFTLTEMPFWLDRDKIDQGRGDGLLISATKLEVLETSGDARKVRISGWRQKGADRIFYELMSHRIFTATLSPKALEQVKLGEEKTDPETELVWIPVSLDAWVKADKLLADRNELWGLAEEMYTASCTSCHGKPDADHYLANQWIGVMKSMKRFISLNKQEYRFVQKYLQLHASDTGGNGHH
ncbi:MAG TPA: cytochrome C [Rhizobiales bacterium]|nr:cytochrome C [Hyphomicrobiales bacterium]